MKKILFLIMLCASFSSFAKWNFSSEDNESITNDTIYKATHSNNSGFDYNIRCSNKGEGFSLEFKNKILSNYSFPFGTYVSSTNIKVDNNIPFEEVRATKSVYNKDILRVNDTNNKIEFIKLLIEMKKGYVAKVIETNPKTKESSSTNYSLKGFTKAINKLSKSCNIPTLESQLNKLISEREKRINETKANPPCKCAFNNKRKWNPEKIIWNNAFWKCTGYNSDGSCKAVQLIKIVEIN